MNRCARDKIYKCSETLVPAFLETVLLQNEVRIVCLFFKKRFPQWKSLLAVILAIFSMGFNHVSKTHESEFFKNNP